MYQHRRLTSGNFGLFQKFKNFGRNDNMFKHPGTTHTPTPFLNSIGLLFLNVKESS